MIQERDPTRRAFEAMIGQDKVRLRDPETGDWLHLSGTCTTRDATWSWLGWRYQADTLRERWLAEGRDWPFVTTHRDDTDPRPAPLHDDLRDIMEGLR